MAKYLLLKHYRRSSGPDHLAVPGADWSQTGTPMDHWTPEEIDDHVKYMNDFAARLEESGEFVDQQALSPEGTFVRSIYEWLELRPFLAAPPTVTE
jgi:hypothetical protein